MKQLFRRTNGISIGLILGLIACTPVVPPNPSIGNTLSPSTNPSILPPSASANPTPAPSNPISPATGGSAIPSPTVSSTPNTPLVVSTATPLSGSLTVKKVADLQTGRYSASTVVYNQQVYIFGGLTNPASKQSEIWKFDPASLQVTKAGDFPTSIPPDLSIPFYRGSATESGGKFYLVGGSSSLSGAPFLKEILSLSPDTWQATKVGVLASARLVETVSYNSKIYAIGGDEGSGQFDSDILEIIPAAGSARKIGLLPSGRAHMAVVLYNGLIYAMGGQGSNSTYFSDILTIDPATGTTTKIGDLPTGRSSLIGTWAAVMKDKIYVIGGNGIKNGQINRSSDILAVDPTTGKVTKVGDLPTARTDVSVSSYQDKIYVMGGNGVLSDVIGDVWTLSDILEISGF